MLYILDRKSLLYKNVTAKLTGLVIVIILVVATIFNFILLNKIGEVRFISGETKAIIIKESQKELEFSPEKLKQYILELNIKFPHIVYAQAKLETGNFQSKIFRTNNNLYGMKVAKRRPTTNKGEENGHAYFNTWQESVIDYAFYQSKYLSDIKTDKEYLQYLKANYAEDTNYVEKISAIIFESQKDLVSLN